MQELGISIAEKKGIIEFTLLRGIDVEQFLSVNVEHQTCQDFLTQVGVFISQEAEKAHFEISKISEAFASLVGPKFVQEISQFLISPPVTLRILCDHPISHQLPWELLPCPQPLGLTQNVRIVRVGTFDKVENPEPKAEYKLSILSAPLQTQNYASLQAADQEASAIANLFHRSKTIVPTCERSATKDKIKATSELLHFLGHGDIRPSGGLLQFADGPFYADDLAKTLNSKTQFCFLSACHTAGDEHAVGAVLVEKGVPAVVAMQGPISDEGARHFARAFYQSLSEGNPVEDAVRDGRFSIQGMGRDWFAPVLLRSGWSDPLTLIRKEEHNFPVMATRFIGRQDEIKAILKLLNTPNQRLITLTGMGGIGKTTLGCRVGLESVGSFADGAFLVPCEAAQSRSDIVAAIAAALEIQSTGKLESDLVAYLRNRQIHLVFDCFERIVELGEYLQELIQTCPELKVLVTSRIVLGLPGEAEFRVPAMSNKRKKQSDSEAVELFVSTAAQYLPGFEKNSKNQASIYQIVDDLESVPLALILAASRLRHFALDELASRIRTNRLETLQRRSSRDDKHADLYRVIGDSLDLLEESDRVLLGILSVFVGGFYLTDAEQVIGGYGNANSIAWLRDNSLLNAHIEGGQMRYRMLDTIREYLQTSAYSKGLEAFEARHAEAFANKAKVLTSQTGTTKWTAIARSYPIDAGNYRRAIEFAVSSENVPLQRTFIKTLARVWTELGRHDELAFVRPLVQSTFANDFELNIEICGLEGELAKRKGDFALAEEYWTRRAELCLNQENFEDYADSLLDMADLGFLSNNPGLTERVLSEFDSIDQTQLSAVTRASGLVLHALVSLEQERPAEAAEYANRAAMLLDGRSPDQGQLYVQMRVAQIFRQQNSLDRALELTRLTIFQAIQTSHFHSAGNALLQLVEILRTTQQAEAASLAVFAGCRIPSEVSHAIRREFRNLAGEFSASEIERWNEKYARSDWTEPALAVARI